LSMGEGSWLIFVERPMSATLLALVLAVLLLPRILRRFSASSSSAIAKRRKAT